jgi:acetolactate synthase-1/3 small subunit
MEEQRYTISIYSENNVGLLNRISDIFLKRHINIESLNVSKSEIDGISKFTIVINTSEDWTQKIVKQIEKQIEVVRAFYHTDEEMIFQQSALFKIASNLLFDDARSRTL